MQAIRRIFVFGLAFLLLVMIVLVVTAGYMVSLGPPEQQREVLQQAQALETQRLASSEVLPREKIPGADDRVQLSIDLREGEFRILPGEPGEPIRIDADYDAGVYALEKEHELAAEGTERMAIRFRSRYSLLRRLLTMGEDAEPENRVDIYLPPDLPLDLDVKISVGESEVDLSGLALAGLKLHLTIGEHDVRFSEPNLLALDTLNITASKGEFTFTELGNAAFREANVKGSMGEVSLDLRGDYLEDASVVTRFRMGECRLTLPEDMHVEVTSSVSMGDRRVSVNTPDELPADAPRLSVDATLSMGELDIRSAAPEGGTADASIVEVTSIIETPSSETPSSETPSSEALAAPAGLSAPEPAPAPEPPPEAEG